MSGQQSHQLLVTAAALVLATSLMLLLGAGWANPSLAEEDDIIEYEADQVVVKLDPAVSGTPGWLTGSLGIDALDSRVLPGTENVYLLQLPLGSDVERVAQELQQRPGVLYAEPNFLVGLPEGDTGHGARARHKATIYHASTQPSDQYALGALNLSCAQSIDRGKGSAVAVLDTGAQLDHPALDENFSGTNYYDFVDDDADPSDAPTGLDKDGNGHSDEMVGHGTHVAGIVDLVAPEAKIMPLRVLDTEGYGNSFTIAEAVLYAERNGADVLNLSLSSRAHSRLLDTVIADATRKGVVVVAAAGNDDSQVRQYPAASAPALAVTSVDESTQKSEFASFGDWVDIAAPGDEIHSAFPTSSYAYWSGTSMATPFVAGQAGLIHSVDPTLSADRVKDLLTGTARSLDTSNTEYSGMLGAGHSDIGASFAQLHPDAACGG